MFVGDVISQKADDPGFNGVGCCSPLIGGWGKNVRIVWIREAKALFYVFFGSLVSGESSVCVNSLTAIDACEHQFFYELLWCVVTRRILSIQRVR